MHLVDDIDLVLPFRGGVGHLLPDLADIVHAVIGSGVDLYHIHGSACRDRAAGRAGPTGISIHRMLTVYRLRENLGHRGLSGSSGAAEQIGMADPIRLYLVFQCSHNMILSSDFSKLGGPELSVEGHIRHESNPLIRKPPGRVFSPAVSHCCLNLFQALERGRNVSPGIPAQAGYQSPKLIPIIFASEMMEEFGSMNFSLPADSSSGTRTHSLFTIPIM